MNRKVTRNAKSIISFKPCTPVFQWHHHWKGFFADFYLDLFSVLQFWPHQHSPWKGEQSILFFLASTLLIISVIVSQCFPNLFLKINIYRTFNSFLQVTCAHAVLVWIHLNLSMILLTCPNPDVPSVRDHTCTQESILSAIQFLLHEIITKFSLRALTLFLWSSCQLILSLSFVLFFSQII